MASLNFGQALERLKNGDSVCRNGWNGKNMFIYLNHGNTPVSLPLREDGQTPLIDGVPQSLFVLGDEGTVTRLPNINMKTATGSTVTGWLASQADLLAEDWGVCSAVEVTPA